MCRTQMFWYDFQRSVEVRDNWKKAIYLSKSFCIWKLGKVEVISTPAESSLAVLKL